MLWMHYLVGISHFAKYGTNRPLTVREMLTNAQKFCSVEENEKVIRNPHADPDHHQKLITSRGSPPCPCLPSYGQRPFPHSSVILFTECQTGWSHNLRLVDGSNDSKQLISVMHDCHVEQQQTWKQGTINGKHYEAAARCIMLVMLW